MKKVTKKALEDAFKSECFLKDDLLSITMTKNSTGELDKFFVSFKEYQITLFISAYGLSGWFNGSLNFTRLERLLRVIDGFNED